MELKARGWRRDMGATYIGNPSLISAVFSDEPPEDGYFRNKTYVIKDNNEPGFEVKWHSEIRLTGDYQVTLTLNRDDIRFFFDKYFGHSLYEGRLEQLKLLLDGAGLTEKLGGVTVRDLARIFVQRE